MIQSWANSRSRRFYEEGKASKFSGMDVEAAEDLLAALDAAESLSDLSPLRSLGLHKLKGDVPSPLDPPPGCKFQGRCPQVEERCREEEIGFVRVEADHLVRCWKVGKG